MTEAERAYRWLGRLISVEWVRLFRSLSVLWTQRSDGDDVVLGFAETGGWYAFVLLVG